MGHKEIEIRKKATSKKTLLGFLSQNAKQIVRSTTQTDIYFTPQHEDYSKKEPIEKWFRLRLSNEGNSLTFKKWYFNDVGKSENHCDEYEINISDGETAKKLISALDFQELVTVIKKRAIWIYNGIEIAIDEVQNLGTFVELEAKKVDGSIQDILEKLEALADELELIEDKSINLGYPILLLKQNGKNK